MTRRLRSHRELRGEVDRAAAYFEEKAGLGHEFVVAVADGREPLYWADRLSEQGAHRPRRG